MSIIKSKYDHREMKSFVLKNELKVLLIEDPDATSDYITMGVGVGYLYDTIFGIAHFLEHMLFIGSKKYPELNYFQKFVIKNGGKTNAYTAHDHTCYFYNISNNALIESLNIFSRFFIDPLFDKQYCDKEINAVNEEHQKNINDDMWRHEDIIKVVCQEDHAYKKFGTGNDKTLKDDKIYEKLLKFYENHYSSDNMFLIICTSEKISKIKDDVIKIFEEIPLKKTINHPEDNLRITGKVLKNNLEINMIPLQSVEKMIIYWDIEHSFVNSFLIYLLSNESKNSIHCNLTTMKLIDDMAATISMHIGDRDLIKITFILTDTGLKNKNIILDVLYQYIKIIKENISSDQLKLLYQEYNKININEFTFRTTETDTDILLDYIRIILSQKINIKNLLNYESIKYDYEIISRELDKSIQQLTSNNSVILISSNSLVDKCDKIYDHYNIKYCIESINYNFNYTEDETLCKVELQLENKYIPEKFNIVILDKEEKITKKPLKIRDSKIKSFYYPITKFNLPLVNINICINLPKLIENNITYLCLIFYIDSFIFTINQEKYFFENAGYSLTIDMSENNILIFISGYSDKIEKVCNYILNLFKKVVISEPDYKKTYRLIKKINENSIFAGPYLSINEIFLKNKLFKYYNSEDKLKTLPKLNNDIVTTVAKYVLSDVEISSFICGNINHQKAISINEDIEKLNKYLCDYKICIDKKLNKRFVVNKIKNEKGIKYYTIKNKNIHETNNGVGYYIFLFDINHNIDKKWSELLCLSKILENIIGERYFSILRTNEQFGYIVTANTVVLGYEDTKSYYLKLFIQSSSKSIDEIKNRNIIFLNEFLEYLKKLKSIKEFVEGCIDSLEYSSDNIDELTDEYFHQIKMNYLNFDYREKLIEGYKKITKKQLIDFYKDKFIDNISGSFCILEVNKN